MRLQPLASSKSSFHTDSVAFWKVADVRVEIDWPVERAFTIAELGHRPENRNPLTLEKSAKMGHPSGEGRLLEDRLLEEGRASARPFGRAPHGLQPLKPGLAKIQKNKENGI